MSKKLTKQDYVDLYLEFLQSEELASLEERLDHLLDANRITDGARYLVYYYREWYGVKQLYDILRRASKAKCYVTYINDRRKWDFEYAWQNIQQEYAKALQFVVENEQCPFEESQCQKLLASGALEVQS